MAGLGVSTIAVSHSCLSSPAGLAAVMTIVWAVSRMPAHLFHPRAFGGVGFISVHVAKKPMSVRLSPAG